MLKLVAETPSGPIIILGITEGNIAQLVANRRPIDVGLGEMLEQLGADRELGGVALRRARIVIYSGATEEEMAQELVDAGFAPPEFVEAARRAGATRVPQAVARPKPKRGTDDPRTRNAGGLGP